MSIQLADRPVKYPQGVAENLLVKVENFVFSADFVILDMEEDAEVPLILRRPFLATAQAVVDMNDRTLTLKFGEEEVKFGVGKSVEDEDPVHYMKWMTLKMLEWCMSEMMLVGFEIGCGSSVAKV
ncbi:uncharacterized protein LOC110887747 [Helianthus annuus]|uniref:uncharacterized protein LOC110887747 n=1 Tax=Helianthus annuus TaxID=4232 RepID=UPI000B8FDC6C|nr:uncharacterized protein LOC110887747 [Helianthus annuus]